MMPFPNVCSPTTTARLESWSAPVSTSAALAVPRLTRTCFQESEMSTSTFLPLRETSATMQQGAPAGHSPPLAACRRSRRNLPSRHRGCLGCRRSGRCPQC
jgi:hypothetical protein